MTITLKKIKVKHLEQYERNNLKNRESLDLDDDNDSADELSNVATNR